MPPLSAENIFRVQTRIHEACAVAGRSADSVRLLAVSKTQAASRIREAASLGLTAFGENYVQEALPKITELGPLRLDWHHIGPIQSNKTADIATHFSWVQGVDRLKIAERLSAQRPHTLPPLNVCLQVNISAEASKSGCTPQALAVLCSAIAQLPGLRLRGLMAIPEPAQGDAPFAAMQQLYQQVKAAHSTVDTLSMGMSGDLELAISHGSTLVRIGSALFGARQAQS